MVISLDLLYFRRFVGHIFGRESVFLGILFFLFFVFCVFVFLLKVWSIFRVLVDLSILLGFWSGSRVGRLYLLDRSDKSNVFLGYGTVTIFIIFFFYFFSASWWGLEYQLPWLCLASLLVQIYLFFSWGSFLPSIFFFELLYLRLVCLNIMESIPFCFNC